MNPGKIQFSFRAAFFFLLGLVLFYISFRQQNLQELGNTLSSANYSLLWLVVLASLGSYLFRSLRWKMLLEAGHNKQLALAPLFCSLSASYLVHLLIPRAGELSRSYLVADKESVSMQEALGTVIMERIADVLVLVLICLLAFWMQQEQVIPFVHQNIEVPLTELWQQKSLLLFFLLLFSLLLLVVYYFLRKKLKGKSDELINGFMQGLLSILKLSKPWLFILYTVLIWGCYFLMTYLWFFCFEASRVLSLQAAFTVMAVGTIGRSVPVQGGGMGAYHFLVSGILMLYGCGQSLAFALALLIHGGQTLFTLCMGLPGFLYFSWRK